VRLQDPECRRGLLPSRESKEPHDAAVGQATHNGQLAEVLVEGDQHAVLCVGARQDLLVRGARVVRSHPRYVDPLVAELVDG